MQYELSALLANSPVEHEERKRGKGSFSARRQMEGGLAPSRAKAAGAQLLMLVSLGEVGCPPLVTGSSRAAFD